MQTSSHAFSNVLGVAPDGSFVGADLGDAYPRGINLYRINADRVLNTRNVFPFKTRHGTTPSAYSGGPTYPVYTEISGSGTTFYQWSNDNATYTELGGVVQTDEGIVALFSTERSVLDNSRLGENWNEPRDLAMVLVRSDFHNATAGESSGWVTDDLVRSAGGPAVEAGYYTFGGAWFRQRAAGYVFLSSLGDTQSASRPRLHRDSGGLVALYEVWTSTQGYNYWGWEESVESHVETRALRLNDNGTAVAGSETVLGEAVRIANRDDAFTLAGGTATAVASGDELVVTVVLPATR